jgi:hypothetical protein
VAPLGSELIFGEHAKFLLSKFLMEKLTRPHGLTTLKKISSITTSLTVIIHNSARIKKPPALLFYALPATAPLVRPPFGVSALVLARKLQA